MEAFTGALYQGGRVCMEGLYALSTLKISSENKEAPKKEIIPQQLKKESDENIRHVSKVQIIALKEEYIQKSMSSEDAQNLLAESLSRLGKQKNVLLSAADMLQDANDERDKLMIQREEIGSQISSALEECKQKIEANPQSITESLLNINLISPTADLKSQLFKVNRLIFEKETAIKQLTEQKECELKKYQALLGNTNQLLNQKKEVQEKIISETNQAEQKLTEIRHEALKAMVTSNFMPIESCGHDQ